MKKYVVEVNNNEYEVLIKEETEVNNAEVESSVQNTVNKTEKQTAPSSDTINSELKEKEEKNEQNNQTKPVQRNVDTTGKEPVDAPMSGRILSIRVNKGDNVSQNQVLMTIEAMKMETEIVAPVSGQIADILVDEGSKCKQGDKLALIKEAGGK